MNLALQNPGCEAPTNPISAEVARAIADSLCDVAAGADRRPGNARLITKLAEYTGLEERFVQPCGALNEALEYVCRAYLTHGVEALIAGPTHAMFQSYAQSCGALLRLSLAPTPFISDMSSLIQSITPETTLIYLMNPNYPTGRIFTQEEIEQLLVSAPDALLIVDEAYFEFYGKTCSQLVRRHDNLIILRRLADAVGMSVFPCSYALASPEIIDCITSAQVDKTIAVPIQVGVIAALNHARSSTEYVRQVRENRTYLALRLQQFGIESKVTSMNAVLLKVAWPANVVSFLNQRDIFAADCSAMPQMDNYVHITVGDNSYCADVIQCFAEMPESHYLLTSFDLKPATSAQKLVLNRGAEAVPETMFADVAGRLSRSGSSIAQRPAPEQMISANRIQAGNTTATKEYV